MSGKGFYGWIALAGAALVYFVHNGITYSYGVFLPAICEETGWTRASVAVAQTVLWAVMGFLGPVSGLFVAKFGPRKAIAFGGLIAASSLALLSQTTESWQLILFFGLILGIGLSLGFFIPTTTIPANWFKRRRSSAFSLLIGIGGIGGLTLPPVVAQLISITNWREAWLFLAIMVLVFVVGIGGFIVRDKPEDSGQGADGSTPAGEKSVEEEKYQASSEWKVREAMHTLPLWLIIGFSATFEFALQVMISHQVAHLEDLGYSSVKAAGTLGLLPGMSIAGRLGYGFLSSTFKPKHLAIGCLGSMAIAVFIFMKATILPLIYAYTVLFGTGYGMLIVAEIDLLTAYYGSTIYPKLAGWCSPFWAAISAAGPWMAGAIYDYTASYKLAFWAVIAFLIIGLICASLLPKST